MTDCTIVIFHFESLAYLRACVREIRRYKHPDISQHIIIADQSENVHVISALEECYKTEDITIVPMPKCGSGYAVDYLIRKHNITTEFICTIDVDTIPIHKNWLYVPIQLILQAGFTWVGVHAQIESAYAYMGDFFCMCQHFRVGRTSTYKELSLNAGFCKNDSRKRFSYENNEWHGWSDDAIIAHWWEDKYQANNKFTFAVTHYLGIAPKEGRYGRYTDGLVLHVGFSYNYKMVRDRKASMGDQFLTLMERMEKGGLSEELLKEMLDSRIPLEAPILRLCWDGDTKTCYTPDTELTALIEKLKAE